MNNNKISLVVVALAIVAAAATTLGFYTPVQDANARCKCKMQWWLYMSA
jgi:hypothetical protein